jgi:hypothetical protein
LVPVSNLIFLGSFLYAFNQASFGNVYNKFSNKAPLIKKYWYFVAPFSLITGILFVAIFRYASDARMDMYISALGQVATLIFAIFAGYLAFLQLGLN